MELGLSIYFSVSGLGLVNMIQCCLYALEIKLWKIWGYVCDIIYNRQSTEDGHKEQWAASCCNCLQQSALKAWPGNYPGSVFYPSLTTGAGHCVPNLYLFLLPSFTPSTIKLISNVTIMLLISDWLVRRGPRSPHQQRLYRQDPRLGEYFNTTRRKPSDLTSCEPQWQISPLEVNRDWDWGHSGYRGGGWCTQ